MRSGTAGVFVAGPRRSIPLHPHVRHQLERNHGIQRVTPRDCTWIVTALQFGHRSPSGRIQQNTTVAAMMRSTKIDTNTIAKIAASDIVVPRCCHPSPALAAPPRRNSAAMLRVDEPRLQPLFYLSPRLDVRHSILDAINDDLSAGSHRRAVDALRNHLITLSADEIRDPARL